MGMETEKRRWRDDLKCCKKKSLSTVSWTDRIKMRMEKTVTFEFSFQLLLGECVFPICDLSQVFARVMWCVSSYGQFPYITLNDIFGLVDDDDERETRATTNFDHFCPLSVIHSHERKVMDSHISCVAFIVGYHLNSSRVRAAGGGEDEI